MKAREKLIIAVSLLACGISIAIFAVVSLGHFIYTPDRHQVPIVSEMYDDTVEYVSTINPLPVPPSTTPTDDQSTDDAKQNKTNGRNLQVNDKKLLNKNHLELEDIKE